MVLVWDAGEPVRVVVAVVVRAGRAVVVVVHVLLLAASKLIMGAVIDGSHEMYDLQILKRCIIR